jgi:hypothetical protein
MLIDTVIFDGNNYIDLSASQDVYKAAHIVNGLQEVFE